jgi:hypothetical protein
MDKDVRMLAPVSLERAGRAALNQQGQVMVPDAVRTTDVSVISEQQGSG